VGGAERTARKRRQQQQTAGAGAVAKARGGGGDRKKVIATVAAVVVLAALVIGGVVWTNAAKNETEGQAIQPLAETGVSAEYSGTREGVVVVSGAQDAPVTLDIYADFLCPVCGQFQQTYADEIEKQINAGAVRVRYHMVPMLVERSDPPGYSLDAANAALAAADAGKFTAFHDSLMAQQPEEGKRGYDNSQLIELGRALGITDPAFAEKVNSGRYEQELLAAFDKTSNDPALFQQFPDGSKGFGTPTVVANGAIVDVGDNQWLTKLVGSPKS
jgi:protein-disulfide isomerase